MATRWSTKPPTAWLARNIPDGLYPDVRRRFFSNLKHLLVGLEFKAALITGHHNRSVGDRPVLFESYFQVLIHEFCVGAFSVIEVLGAAHWLRGEGRDGSDADYVPRARWLAALCTVYDPEGQHGLMANIETTLGVRDRLHQDRLGARAAIDWHSFTYDAAYVPASAAVRCLLARAADAVPEGVKPALKRQANQRYPSPLPTHRPLQVGSMFEGLMQARHHRLASISQSAASAGIGLRRCET